MNESKNLIVALAIMVALPMAGNLLAQDIPSVHGNLYQTDSGLVYRDSAGKEVPH